MSEISVPILSDEIIVIKDGCPRVECPFCHEFITPKLVAGKYKPYSNITNGDAIFMAKCPCCESSHFISCNNLVKYYGESCFTVKGEWKVEALPKERIKYKEVPEIIDGISPKFRQIYEESQAAEQLGYTQICGGGYRKALEFLIKDYASFLYPEMKDRIESDTLANCILKCISNKFIQIYADRASWLGNDELHYRRVWENKDIFDLKALIEASILAIKIEEEGKKLEKDMPKQENLEKKNKKKK